MKTTQYKALSNCPFNIKKDDILILREDGICTTIDGRQVPINPNDETSFFSVHVEIKGKFPIGTTVTSFNKTNTLKGQPYVIKRYLAKGKAIYAKLGGHFSEVKDSDLIEYKEYFFINSSGTIHRAIKGKDSLADRYRELTGNLYESKDVAQAILMKYKL